MAARTTGSAIGLPAIPTRVARVKALIGLKTALPSSLTQISSRIFDWTGALSPAFDNAWEIARHR